jgi:cytochrome c oxidase subunit IV
MATTETPGPATELERAAADGLELAPRDFVPAPGLLPGEVSPHPSPFKYVMIAVILVVITAVEIATSYLEGDIPDGLIVTLLLGMAVIKFSLVVAWYMHLKTDLPIFRRFFILGLVAAVVLYAVVIGSLHGFGN